MDNISPKGLSARNVTGVSVETTIKTATKATAKTTTSTPTTTQHIADNQVVQQTSQQKGQQISQNNVSALINLLKSQGSISAKVQSSQVLDQTAQKLLQQVNPDTASKLLNNINGNHKGTDQKQNLYLIKLINLKTQQPLLHTVSKNPLKAGTQLSLQLNQQQQIVIKPTINQIEHTIINHLKKNITQQSPNINLFKAANTLLAQEKNYPMPLLSKETVNILQNLQQSQMTYSNSLLNDNAFNKALPQILKQLINDSGLFTENKIARGETTQSDLRTLLFQLGSALLKSENISSGTSSTNTTLTHTVTTENLHPSLLQLLGISTENQKLELTLLKQTLQQQLKTLIQKTQERIQFNQIRSLLGEQSSDNTSTIRQQNIHVDMPLRWGDQTLPLHINIYSEAERTKEEQEQEQKNNKEKNDNKTLGKCWQVVLSFDLPDNQSLDAQLTVTGDKISTTFWSESLELYTVIKGSLPILRQLFIDNNLQVDELQCISGKSPAQKFSLDYHLVDVVT